LTLFFGGRAGFDLIEGFNPKMALLNDLEPVFPGLSKAHNRRYGRPRPFPVAAIPAIDPASKLALPMQPADR